MRAQASKKCMGLLREAVRRNAAVEMLNAVAVLDERRVVSASSDKTLGVWDIDSGETLRTLEGHTLGVGAVAVLDEKRVVSASNDQTLRMWDVETGETTAVFALDGPVTAVAVTANGDIVAGDSLGGVHFLDLLSTHRPLAQM